MASLAAGLAVGAILIAAAIAAVDARRARRALRAAREEAAARSAEIAVLHALGLELAAAPDAERVFTVVDRECRKVLPVDEIVLGLLDLDGSGMTVRVRSASERAPRVLREPATRERRPSRSGRTLAVPLLGGEEILGLLCVRGGTGRPYDDRDLAALAALAGPVALAALALRRARGATADRVTGLPLGDLIAARLLDELARARRHGTPVAVLMADVDGFRSLNERHGFEAGNRFLAAAAETLRQHLRASDLAVRHGVDVFCIILPATDLAGAERLAERLRAAVAGLRVASGEATLSATASFGVAAHPEHGATVRTLLFRADAALHRAKRAGRDRVTIATL